MGVGKQFGQEGSFWVLANSLGRRAAFGCWRTVWAGGQLLGVGEQFGQEGAFPRAELSSRFRGNDGACGSAGTG